MSRARADSARKAPSPLVASGKKGPSAMSSSYSTIRLERDGGIATLTLDRSDSANALNLEMATELMRAAIELDEDAGVRAVILTGNGKMFCAGGDLGAMKEAGDGASSYIKEMAGNLHLAVSRFARMRSRSATRDSSASRSIACTRTSPGAKTSRRSSASRSTTR